MSSINTILPREQIQVIETMDSWQAAAKLAGQPLLTKGFITKNYIQSMIQSVNDYGPYMVIADYFALLHARPGEGVNQQSMSLLVIKEPVDMLGKPVKIFMVLAAEDNQSHLDSLQKIMAIFMEPKNYQIILNGSKEEIITLFSERGIE